MASHPKLVFLWGLFLIFAALIYGCDSLPFINTDETNGTLSGVVEVVNISVAPQVGGRVNAVYVSEGDSVISGTPLFDMEDTLLSSQYKQAKAGLEAAQSNLEAAMASLELAQASFQAAQIAQELAHLQHQQVLNFSRLEDMENRSSAWNRPQPNNFQTPPWFFTKQDMIAAAEAEVMAAEENLDEQLGTYNELLRGSDYDELRAAEERLAQAQTAFLVALSLQDTGIAQTGREQLQESVQRLYDDAQDELEAAQANLDEILEGEAEEEILTSRANVTVAQERYETALDLWSSMLTGDQSLQVHAAELGVEQAQANLEQADAGVSQAQAGVTAAEKVVDQAESALKIIEIQMEELFVTAPETGVILLRSIEPGEVIQPGMTAMTIGKLDELTVTVYVPEDQYGQIDLGDIATIKTDSFPDENFQGTVTRIADQAEYTPRNVGTEDDRSTIVFAVELSVMDSDYRLKPGMIVDVGFFQD